ncbi:MAG: GntR family transcriptional regulator [Chloroflexi bacterium]|nr:MAG: GntR family transcriptional regulator [Chloroflexota bacterium]
MAKPQYQRKMKSLTDQVYDKVRTDIISLELLPGDRIVELDIAETMGTSQAPVREALQRLEREGLVNRQARSATYVTKTSIDEIYELFSIRSQIEGYAIKRTVRHITPTQIMELEALVEQMKAAGELDNMVLLTEYDMLFHRNICQWADSVALLRSWDPLFSQIQRFVVNTHKDYFDELTDIADTHLPIIAALRAGDEEEAARVVREHVMLIWTRIEQKK